jgi:hypothetical protein
MRLSDREVFPNEHLAQKAGEAFLRTYPPQGYGSQIAVMPEDAEEPLGSYVLLTSRYSSCD